jgi:hypothetical protein
MLFNNSVYDKRMNDHVASVEGFGTGGGKQKYSEENLFQWQFVHHKSDMELPRIEPWYWG